MPLICRPGASLVYSRLHAFHAYLSHGRKGQRFYFGQMTHGMYRIRECVRQTRTALNAFRMETRAGK